MCRTNICYNDEIEIRWWRKPVTTMKCHSASGGSPFHRCNAIPQLAEARFFVEMPFR